MIRPLRSILFTAAIGLVLNTAAVVHCHAYPFGKHGQTVYVVPSTTAVTTVGSAPVVYTTGSAPATYTTGSAPTTIIYQTQAATGGAPATGSAPTETPCTLSADDQNDIVVQLRELMADNKDSSRTDLRETLTTRANELVASYCGKEAEVFTAADTQLVRALVRQALYQRPVGSAPGMVGMAGYAPGPGTVTAPAVQYVQYPQYVQQPMILVPVQFYAPAPPPSHHHFFCRCQSCVAKRGY